MPETRDPAIKLFGRTIALPAAADGGSRGGEDEDHPNSEEHSERTCSTSDDNQKHSSDDQDGESKALKNPDTILPCPRCDSLETKFCTRAVLSFGSDSNDRVNDLGKRSREEEADEGERCRLWIPKNPRIRYPEESATGFESERALLKPFLTKGEPFVRASQALRANPAALSRFVDFMESA